MKTNTKYIVHRTCEVKLGLAVSGGGNSLDVATAIGSVSQVIN